VSANGVFSETGGFVLRARDKKSDYSHLTEEFFAGKDAARKERAAKATDANRRENRSDARALAAAIATVCARGQLTPKPGEKFARSIRAEVRGELEASHDPKIQKKLLSRHGVWPSWHTISRLIKSHS
jgi:hypothetical protein